MGVGGALAGLYVAGAVGGSAVAGTSATSRRDAIQLWRDYTKLFFDQPLATAYRPSGRGE